MDLKKYECTQCGSHDFEELEEYKIKCKFCSTVFRVTVPDTSKPKVIIGKGANVIFGKSSNVIIQGGLKIENEANVQFLGKLDIIEEGDKEKYKKK